jgi:hypothetical protein
METTRQTTMTISISITMTMASTATTTTAKTYLERNPIGFTVCMRKWIQRGRAT